MAAREADDYGEVLTLDQVAQLLSADLQTVQKMVTRGTIPAYRLPGSRRWYVPKAQLLDELFHEDRSNRQPKQ